MEWPVKKRKVLFESARLEQGKYAHRGGRDVDGVQVSGPFLMYVNTFPPAEVQAAIKAKRKGRQPPQRS